jgi:hypothetical protein
MDLPARWYRTDHGAPASQTTLENSLNEANVDHSKEGMSYSKYMELYTQVWPVFKLRKTIQG